ncbi:MAG: glycosyltransferase family 2 protein [Methanobacteriaceae archaeon]|nr:glycosyltransferase family 2 protein [Methanobacteriaceae archaeon]
MSLLSIVVPCLNEEKNIAQFYGLVSKIMTSSTMSKLDYEFIFIDDGSTDKTLKGLKFLSNEDKHVKYISFSRNFGKESAIYAGLEYSKGDYVVIMDADLQDPPSLLPEMYYNIILNKYDSVATRRVSRKGEPFIRSFFARKFYKIINKMSKIEIVDGSRDYRMMTRNMVDSILKLKEVNRFSKGIFSWVGFKTKWLEYENIQRANGETSWSFWNLFLYSIEGIVGFTTVPLAISTIIGIIFSIVAFILMLIILIKTILFGDHVAGWPSLVCIVLFLGGIQLFSIGILGEYLSKTYIETKNRPIYIEKESNIKK